MTLQLEGIDLASLEMTSEEFLLEVAIMLYTQGRLSMGKASQLAKINRILFQEELGKRKIPVNYNEAELDLDLVTLGLR